MLRKKVSVYNQLLLLFGTVMLPFIIAGICVLHNSNQRMKAKELEARQRITHNTIAALDSTLENIYTSNFLLFEQDNIRALSNRIEQLSQYEKIHNINTLRDQMTSINRANSLIEHIRIYFKTWGRVYNSAGYPAGSFQEFSEKEYEQIVSMVQSGKIGVLSENNLSIYIVVNPLYEPSAVIEVILSISELEIQLQNLLMGSNDFYMLTLSERNSFQLHNIPDTLQDMIFSKLDLNALSIPAVLEIEEQTYHVLYEELPFINGNFFRLVPDRTLLSGLQTLTLFTGTFVLLVLSATIVFLIFSRYLIHRPLTELVSGFSEIEKGNYSVQIACNNTNEFSYLYNGFNQMAANMEQYIDRNYKMNLLLHQAELKQLQAQINPHFLYNSFFMLQSFIKSDLLEEALEVTSLLGKYFQYITKNSNNLVPLKEEYNHAQIYSQIQEMRFEGRITVNFEKLPEAFSNLMVPKLILQPVLENCYNYGLKNKMDNGFLRVHFSSKDTCLKIFIEDNGESLTPEHLITIQENLKKAQSGAAIEMTGILNICRRLNIFSNGRWNLSASRSELGGLCICITLYKEHEHESIINC